MTDVRAPRVLGVVVRRTARHPAAGFGGHGRLRVRRPVRIRWRIFAFILALPLLSYIQRLSVQDLAETIMPSLHVSQLQIGWLATAFTTAYALAQFPGGLFALRFGARLTLVLAGVLGVTATLAFPLLPMVLAGTALFGALLFVQTALGISQGPLFPATAAVIESWLPAKRWAMANGVQTVGNNLGGAITPVLVALLSESFGWQGALLWIALPVALLTTAWGWYGRNRPRDHRAVTAGELAELDNATAESPQPLSARRLLKVLGDRNILLNTFSYLCACYVYYLLGFWSFLYLVEVRHFSGIEAGLVGALPWIGAAVGSATGGVISDFLAIRIGVRWGYRLLPLLTLPFAGLLLLVTLRAPTPLMAVATLAAAFLMVELNEGAYAAALMSVARSDVAAAIGVQNTGGNVAGIIALPLVAFLTNSGAWNGAFATGTVFALVAAGVWLVIDPERRADVHGAA